MKPEQPYTAYDLIDKAVELDIQVVQLADNLPFENLGDQSLSSIHDYAVQKGIQIEVGMRKLTIDRLDKFLRICEILDSRLLRCVIDGETYEPSVAEIVTIINSRKQQFRAKNVIFGIENHDRFFSTEFAEIVIAANDPNVGIVLDTVNSFSKGESSREVVANLAQHTVCFHVKDFVVGRIKNSMGLIVTGVPAGKGLLDVPETLKILKNHAKTDFSTILEFWMAPAQTIKETIMKEDQWTQESIHYLKNQVGIKNN